MLPIVTIYSSPDRNVSDAKSPTERTLRGPRRMQLSNCNDIMFGQLRLWMPRANHSHLLPPEYPVAVADVVTLRHILKIGQVVVGSIARAVINFVKWRRRADKGAHQQLVNVKLSPAVCVAVEMNAKITVVARWANRSRLGSRPPAMALTSDFSGIADRVIPFVTRNRAPFHDAPVYLDSIRSAR